MRYNRFSGLRSALKPPEIPTEKQLLSNKKARLQDQPVLKIVTQLFFYGALLYLVYTLSFENRDMMSYHLKQQSVNLFEYGSVSLFCPLLIKTLDVLRGCAAVIKITLLEDWPSYCIVFFT